MSEYTVIDVSTYQRQIDWEKVKPQIKGAIIRIGYGNDDSKQDDDTAVRNMTECERLGIPWGPYIYSYATTDSMLQSEYNHMKRVVGNHNPTFPWYIDLEENDCAWYARKAAEAWAKLCKADGKTTGVYTGYYYFNTHIRGIDTSQASWWIASYGTNDGTPQASAKPKVGFDYDGWQYTSVKRFNGISGGVDTSLFYKDFGTGMWKQEWFYYNADGSIKKSAWQKDSKGWCYLKADGRAAHDEWINDKAWYYLKSDCHMAHDEWAKDSVGWCYLGPDGKAVKDKWVKWKGDWYYLKSDYHMAHDEYAYDSKGKCWLQSDGKWDGKYY